MQCVCAKPYFARGYVLCRPSQAQRMSGNKNSGLFALHSQNVHQEDRDGSPKNTKRVYDGIVCIL